MAVDRAEGLFGAAGTLRDAYDAVDWAATPVGEPATWSPTMRAVTDLALNTDFAVTLLWGPEFTMLYNESYVPILGDKHPAALGACARDVFPEVWDQVGPMMRRVRDGGGAELQHDIRLLLDRHGFAEECFFTFCYSPVGAAAGGVEGVVDIVTETTTRTIAHRRLELLTTLGQELTADLRDEREIAAVALPLLRGADLDLRAVDLRATARYGNARPGVFGSAPTVWDDDVVLERTAAGDVAWVRLVTAVDTGTPPVLAVLLSENLVFDRAYRDFLQLIAVALAQALDRISARDAEQRSLAAERGLSEALQRSLLTHPPHVPGLDVAVRYHPAVEQARVGGDWYDAFLLPDGALVVSVGDVSGHDRQAAATMAQVRNLLRGITYTFDLAPAAALTGLDQAVQGLAGGALATAVVARVAADPAGRVLQWSNAGHPPPVLLGVDGTARVLARDPDVMLGVATGADRHEHREVLPPGSTVVFYTDGLVERRDADLHDSIDELAAHLAARAQLSVEALCDDLLDRYATGAEDDIVLLVVRVAP